LQMQAHPDRPSTFLTASLPSGPVVVFLNTFWEVEFSPGLAPHHFLFRQSPLIHRCLTGRMRGSRVVRTDVTVFGRHDFLFTLLSFNPALPVSQRFGNALGKSGCGELLHPHLRCDFLFCAQLAAFQLFLGLLLVSAARQQSNRRLLAKSCPGFWRRVGRVPLEPRFRFWRTFPAPHRVP